MKTIVTRSAGGPEVLELQEKEIPVFQDDEVLIKVIATSVNKIDLIERKEQSGKILGHECSGIIVGIGKNVTRWQVNDKVCALLRTNGYAEFVAVPSVMIFSIPPNITFEIAAGIPMLVCSTYHALIRCGVLEPGKTLLIHDAHGFEEFGMFSLSLAKALYNVPVFVVSDDDEILYLYQSHGADKCINWRNYNIYRELGFITKKRGVDVILNYGGRNLIQCQNCLALWGTMVVVLDVQKERTVDFDISDLKHRSGRFIVLDLKWLMTSASSQLLALLVKSVNEQAWSFFNDGKLKVKKHPTKPLSMAASVHALMEKGKVEKVVLTTEEKPKEEWKFSVLKRVGSMMGFLFRNKTTKEDFDSILPKKPKIE